ncbi:MAG: 4Fe-4S binding protein [Synergistaceae bacterium]|jgi:polyferredoxin|nr:4Fe-4S binding protein [Synergistaceae bacterium]
MIRIASLVLYVAMMLAGWAFPILGIFLLAAMGIAVIAGRRKKWCSSYCPRGSFLDLVMSKLSPRKPIPRFLLSKRTWAAGLAVFSIVFAMQLRNAGLFGPWDGGSLSRLGLVFYRMCLVSSAIAIPLALWKNHRSWCAVCPVGNLLRR